MSYNVPVVNDGLPARIRALRSKTRAGKLLVEHGVGVSEATDLAMRNPSRFSGVHLTSC
jgi:hypothetical protein